MPRPFVGIPSFLRSRILREDEAIDADVAVLGAPTDEGSPFIPGSRFAPRSIREQSMRFGAYDAGYYDADVDRTFLDYELSHDRIVDLGDAEVIPTAVEVSFDNITSLTRRALSANAMPIVLGGDHAISFPVVRAFERPIQVVHFDAHADYAPFQHGLQYTNAHAFRHISHMDHVLALTQVGIRGLRNPRVWVEDSRADGNAVVTLQRYNELGPTGLAESVLADTPIYVSVDIDVLDMSLVPGCVSAEPNGMLYADLHNALSALAVSHEIVGMDLVEVNPMTDVGSGVTSYLAAHTIVRFLGVICDQPWWKQRRAARHEDNGGAS
jgi:agmatinase